VQEQSMATSKKPEIERLCGILNLAFDNPAKVRQLRFLQSVVSQC
jgi:hypothetical protein